MKNLIVLSIIVFFFSKSYSQGFENFSIEIEEVNIQDVPGVHSFAYGVDSSGKWLIIGGKVNGLHLRQPFMAFLDSTNNKKVYVIDEANNQVWSTSLDILGGYLFDQMQSTNMTFFQRGNTLYFIGGYGYSFTEADHITYPYITAIDVNELANAVINGNSVNQHFRQIEYQNFAVAGGQIGYLDSIFYLVGGNRFDGQYNPMGNPTYTQEYTDEIRKFKLNDDGNNLLIENYIAIKDTDNLHRRDYNLAPQIFPNGEHGFTVFSGVFQRYVDLPFLNIVDITPTNYTVNNNFNQYLSQYHSPKLPIYDSLNNAMHTIFFGGMSQYTLDTTTNLLIEDSDVPFVKTISRITRFFNDSLEEVKLGIEMPRLLGSGAEFIPTNLTYYDDEILKINTLPNTKTLVGYIYGGIESSLANIFFINDNTQSDASSAIFKVFVNKSQTSAENIQLNPENIFGLKVYPNPVTENTIVEFFNPNPSEISLILFDINGKKERTVFLSELEMGKKKISVNFSDIKKGTYNLVLDNGVYKSVVKLSR